MKQQIKIDKGIPIPIRLKYPLGTMDVGDSFLIDKTKRTGLSSLCLRHKPKKFASRAVSETEVRVWRIE